MSQRQVNLKGGDQFAQSLKSSVDSVSKGVSKRTSNIVQALAKKQQAERAASDKAINNGNQTTAEFMKAYGDKVRSSNVEFNTGLNNYVRQQAELIGNARTKAESPNATPEDRSAYLDALQTSQQNLESVAAMSLVVEQDKRALALDQQAMGTDSPRNRLARGAKLNSSFIGFESALLSGTAQGIKFSTAENGGTVISLTDLDGNPQQLNVSDFNQAFQQTGETIAGASITEDELLIGNLGNSWLKETENWPDVKPMQLDVTGLNEEIDIEGTGEDETLKIRSKRIAKTQKNLQNVILDNHQDWLDSKINFNFGKTWDQLCLMGDKFVTDSSLRDISWETLNYEDPEKGVKEIKALLGDEEMFVGSGYFDGEDFSVDDYKELQEEIKNEARYALSLFMAEKLKMNKTVSQKIKPL